MKKKYSRSSVVWTAAAIVLVLLGIVKAPKIKRSVDKMKQERAIEKRLSTPRPTPTPQATLEFELQPGEESAKIQTNGDCIWQVFFPNEQNGNDTRTILTLYISDNMPRPFEMKDSYDTRALTAEMMSHVKYVTYKRPEECQKPMWYRITVHHNPQNPNW